MRKNILAFCLTLFFSGMYAQQAPATHLNIIPEPVSTIVKKGTFSPPKHITVSRPDGADNDLTVNFLTEKLRNFTDGKVTVKNSGKATIQLILNTTKDTSIGNEGYTLTVLPKNITIRANSAAGLFYGVQTLVQLFPPEIESPHTTACNDVKIPVLEITDYPRVGWRGLMLDVARHFFTVDEVKQYIDKMVRYKYNMLHWHLTDDEGWRIEIKSLPKLTSVGAWRVEKTGWFGSFAPAKSDEPKNYGGYYTQEQIKDVIAYAKERHVQIMPEIDVPGHSSAALAAYPDLSCFPETDDKHVRDGAPFLDWNTGGRPAAIMENTLCPANENVYDFMDKVLTEVAALFPFEYIHTGGDEAPYTFWEKSPAVKQLMEREGLKNMAEVQSWFGKRVEKIILAKGKKMMGWDEILEGGITPTTGLMSWRGISYGIEASKSGHPVVMSPSNFVYIDLMQGDVSTEPRVYNSLRLNQTYKFNPIPEGSDGRYILGGQGNLWTEQIYNMRQAEYMTWPRGLAIAESLWSPEGKKDYNNFIRKTENHFIRFDFAETKYSRAMYDPIIRVKKEGENYLVELTPEIEGLDIYTSFDNSEPDRFYPKYSSPQFIPKDAGQMKITTYKGTKRVGRMITLQVEDLKRRVK
ncbi:MAG TPA: family 20 glycosylhydrolase [Paludibacteraceae bacterium]|nr:family 20 glycosylhydrolase [Paludibacteraceae bacterium]